MFNRLFFCDKCYLTGGPHPRDECLIYDYKSGTLILKRFQTFSHLAEPLVKGFTPHIVQMVEESEKPDSSLLNVTKVNYQMICSICGVEFDSMINEEQASFRIKEIFSFSCNMETWMQIVKASI